MPNIDPFDPSAKARNDAIDVLRGLVMVLMALDHARDFVMGHGNPTNLANTTVPLFLTRWVTHFCAPVFVLLAGVGAGLSRRRKSPRELSWFLVTRGLWLVVLEVTLVRLGWMLNVNYHFMVLQVIWVIGWSMVILAALVWAPPIVAGVFGLVLVCGHNLLDGIHADQVGWAWTLIHEQKVLSPIPWTHVMVAYPLVPWAGVLALGYYLGTRLPSEVDAQRRLFLRLGLALTASFVIVRGINLYGDPNPWSVQPRGTVFTLLSFLNCQKYPPSLAYLLMTIGPAFVALAWLTGRRVGWLGGWLQTFGRVPLFYYLLHLYVLHAVSIAAMAPKLITDAAFRAKVLEHGNPGWGLEATYAVWLVTVVLLAWPSRWYAGVKQRSKNPWLSYL